jgi:Aldehyde dehydrogenase family
VLSVIRVADFDEALDVANGTEYGLTGGLYSGDESRIERARRDFHVGNLYINRKITGALVGIQPFGGFNMSGSNAKAGGPDYLRLFMEMKTVARRGGAQPRLAGAVARPETVSCLGSASSHRLLGRSYSVSYVLRSTTFPSGSRRMMVLSEIDHTGVSEHQYRASPALFPHPVTTRSEPPAATIVPAGKSK